MKPMPQISAVLFDYGLVLTGPPHPPAWERMRETLQAGEDAFHAAYWAPRHDYDRGALNGISYWKTVARALGHELNTAQLDTLLAADTELWTQPNAEMIAWAAALQRAGVKTGILSNLGDAMERGVREQCSWIEDFAHHTFSHRLGMAKPEAAIYAHAAEGLATPPEEILFIDDRAENIAAARAAGMQAIQYTSHADFVAAMQRTGLGHLLSPGASGT